jgi:hypothetical protein
VRYVVDENGWSLPNEAGLTSALDQFVDLISRCREEGGDIAKSGFLDYVELLPGRDLWSVLSDATVDRDLRVAVQQALSRCVLWEDRYDLPDPVMASIGGAVSEAWSVSWAHARAGRREACALVVLDGTPRQGRKEVARGDDVRALHFVATSRERLAFLRELSEVENLQPDGYMELAPLAFPDLCFAEGLAAQCGRFSRRFDDVRATLTQHLAALNDEFQAIMRAHHGLPSEVQTAFRAKTGVDSSPESPNTKADAKAWGERRIAFGGKETWCEWHTKLEPHRDRIYFHPGNSSTAGGRLIVGIFHLHLS